MKHLHAIVWKEGKWFVARALEVEVASQGRTQKTALDNLKEALELYFEDQSKIELTTIRQPELQEVAIQLNA